MLLIYFTRKRPELRLRPVFYLFAAFITACGWTHFMGYWTFEHPVMRLDGLVKLVTAFVSWATVLVIIPLLPKALQMRSPEQLQEEVDRRTADLAAANSALTEAREAAQALNVRLQRAMSETHHRVKNNLQMVCALVDLQAIDHPQSVPTLELIAIARHVRALAAVHNLLTIQAKTDLATERTSLRTAIDQILPLMREIASQREITLEAQDAEVPISFATSFALVVNELVTNAVKHGRGAIAVFVEVSDTQVTLVVDDDGPGFPAGFDLHSTGSTGLTLVESLTSCDLNGNLTFGTSPAGGGRVELIATLGATLPAVFTSDDIPFAADHHKVA